MGTTGQSITLANSIIGVGILAMPFCFQQCGVLLATLILMLMGLVSRLCCYFLLKSAIITRRRNYEFLAFHVFGPVGKMAVEMGIIGFLMGTCIAYFVVVGDLGPQIIAKMLNINQSDILRTSIMIIVSLVCVLPLGLLRNVDSLSNVSAATIAFYFCLVIKVIAEATGQLFTTDWVSRIELWKPSGVLQCVPIFSMALFCQTQLFEIFESLPTISLEKMCVVTKNAINICTGVYFTLGIFGYIAFSSQEISGNILMSLSPTMASDVIKLGFVMSLAFSFPLIIFPCRASLYSFLYRRAQSPGEHSMSVSSAIPAGPFRALTLGIVGAALVVGLALPTVELVLGLVGATIGVLVCLVFPAAAFLHLTYKDTNERLFAKFVVVLGFIILVLGTYANLQAAENTRDKYDDRYITQERIDKIVEDFFQQQRKFEEVVAKPQVDTQQVLHEDTALNNPVIKDSEVQPPNPVPPESHSNEKIPVHFPIPENKVVRDMESKESLYKGLESHPKDVKAKMNGIGKLSNGQLNSVEKSKIISDKADRMKKEKQQSSQEKSDMMKQQKLIETIKQHGQEQKELIKEQKEILDELLKTKKELQQNKKDIDSSEAKKIAVESIQKIANVAIQKISGVSEKPDDDKKDKNVVPLEKIENEAIDKIAKKAEEALDAIQQMDKVKIEKEKKEFNELKNKESLANEQGVNNLPKLEQNGNNVEDNMPIKNPDQNIVDQNAVKGRENNLKREIPKANTDAKSNNLKQNENNKEPKNGLTIQEVNNLNKEVNSQQEHNIVQNLLPEVKAEKETLNKNMESQPVKSDVNQNGAIKFKADDILSNIANGRNIIPRRKREVVDCTEKTMLKPEDKEICENFVNIPYKETQESILPKVNLGEVGISNSLHAIASHHLRSLKSIQEDKRR